MRIALALLAFFPCLALAALTPDEHPLFSGDAVHEIELTFHQADWWDQLVDNFEGVEDPEYIPAEFDWAGTHFDSIGVRFKGNSSYNSYPGVKKSFKLDIDRYDSTQNLDGLDKLNLNNQFMDPSFVREICAYEIAEAAGLASCRTNYAALSINGEYWGFYVLVEQVDQEFIESRFGSGEDGNLWKGDPHGSLEYRGAYDWNYYNDYELKTNEELNDWSALVDLADRLNNTALAELPDSLHAAMDAGSALAMLAVDLLTVNLDSYPGSAHNYYLYHRELDDRFLFAKWDQNEAWGVFNMWGMNLDQLKTLDPFWTTPQPGQGRPLGEQLWQDAAYEAIYRGHLLRLMAGAGHPEQIIPRMETLRDLARPWVLADTNKMFSDAEFEAAMTSNLFEGPRLIPALTPFITDRHIYLRSQLGDWDPTAGLVLNEMMANNVATISDEMGDYDDWVEIHNAGALPVSLDGFALADLNDGMDRFEFPAVTIDPGEYLIVWCDGEPGEGDLHAPFRLDGDGEGLYLLDGWVIQDEISFPAQPQDLSYGRWPDGEGDWHLLSVATPGAENDNPLEPETVPLFINELLAVNTAGITDEMGQYEDWLEIYNPGPDEVQMGGLFLSDDLGETTMWAFPDTTLPAGEFLLVWCDSDEGDGPLHANFKLSSDGEEVGLFGRLAAGNDLIDGHAFGSQFANISEGREYDGSESWVYFTEPTPGASNGSPTDIAGDLPPSILLLHAPWPNPFNPVTRLGFDLPRASRVRLEVYDVSGRRIADLLDDWLEAGPYEMDWHALDATGRELASGVYLLRLHDGEDAQTRRLVLLR